MDNMSYFKAVLHSMPNYRKIVIIMFLIENDVDFLHECGYLKNDFYRLCMEFEETLFDQNWDYLECVKHQEEAFNERIPIKRECSILCFFKPNKWNHVFQRCLKMFNKRVR